MVILAWCQTELIEEAAKRWRREEGDYRDDITAIVVRLPLPQSDEEQTESAAEEASNTVDTVSITNV